MKWELSAFVEADLDAIAAFFAEGNPRRAVTFIRDIRSKFKAVQRTPSIYQPRPDIGEAARMASAGNDAILFRIAGGVVRIERVVFAGRDLPGEFDAPATSCSPASQGQESHPIG